jgi:transglutaminase-like putative cysteine protease
MWLSTECKLAFEIKQPTPFLFMLRAQSGMQQWVAEETYQVFPSIPVIEISDKYGNLCQRLVAPVGDFRINTSSIVRTAAACDADTSARFVEVENLPDETLEYLLPSRYCESDLLNDQTLGVVSGTPLGYQQVSKISDWIRDNIQYEPGSSNVPVSAVEIITRGKGVCRDLAHVGISMCRSLCIPARLVVGYLHGLEPMDIHAWFEAYVGDRWFTFDPTQSSLDGGRIVIAYGRDAADVAISNQFGPAVFPYLMDIQIDLLHDFKSAK